MVAAHLQDAIIGGAIDLGEALSEDSIAEVLGVSRTPVRQALQLLQTRGLVTIVPRSGSYVFEPTEAQISEMCDFRLTMELQAATWAFQRRRADAAAALAAVVDTMSTAISTQDLKAYGRADTDYHEVFFAHCENEYMSRSYTFSFAQVAALRTHLAAYTKAEPARSFADHQRLRDIFDSGAESEIEAVLAPHILRTKENYTSTLRERQQRSNETRVQQLRRVLVPFRPDPSIHPTPHAAETGNDASPEVPQLHRKDLK